MSGDVQPRKRKDKKRKRDDRKSEAEIVFSRKQSLQEDEEPREQHQGVHDTNMGSDDVHLHVQSDDHGTGGHWCAKVFFFSLLAILLGLIGLIILENRGISDLDTPLSQSRFSNYFEGWVDESRPSHDEHDVVTASIEEHEHDDEPFEEEEDHSAAEDDEDEHDNDDEHDDDEHDDDNNDDEEDDEENNTEEENDDGGSVKAKVKDEDDEEDEDDDDDAGDDSKENDKQTAEEDDDDDEDNDNDDDDDDDRLKKRSLADDDDDDDNDDDNNKSDENDTNDDDDDEDNNDNDNDDDQDEDDNIKKHHKKDTNNDNDDDSAENETKNAKNDDDDDDDNDDDDDDDDKNDDNDPFDESDTNKSNKTSFKPNAIKNSETVAPHIADKNPANTKLPLFVAKKEDDEDDAFDSVESIVDNDAEELLLLQEKARLQAEQNKAKTRPAEEVPYASPLTVKFIIGVALALVARFVLIRKKPDTTEEIIVEEQNTSSTTTSPPGNTDVDSLNDELLEYDPEEEYSEEEIEIEIEEIVEIGEDEDENVNKYIPETFEQLSALYKSGGMPVDEPVIEEIKPTESVEVESQPFKGIITKTNDSKLEKGKSTQPSRFNPNAGSLFGDPVKTIKEPVISVPDSPSPEPIEYDEDVEYVEEEEEGIEYDDDEEIYDDEEVEEEDGEEEDEELSEIDDTDLMKRLEAKYGKLPTTQYDSEEEDIDAEDQSWTKIKPKVGGGPQSYVEDEFLAAELRQANEEMMRDNLEPALKLYDAISHKYPDYPQAFYGKAKALDKLSELHQSNQILGDSIEAYKRYLAFGEDLNDDEFKEAAERCIDRMRFKGIHMQAIAIHQMLVKRFTEEPYYRNQMAVTYLQVNRLADAKLVLHETLLRWRNNGFALVHYGFVLKSLDKNLELGARYLREGIESGADGTQEGKFFFHLGDCLQRLGRSEEARQVYRKGVEKKLFLSEYQRSLYNCGNLKAQPFWNKAETTYEKFFNALEINWEKIRDEGLGALNQQGYFIDESENLRDVGDWKEFELFARGYKNNKNCIRAPLTCGIIEMFPAARYCKRGQIKFSVLHPSTHVWPHCGPTNCRLRAHLGLQVPAGTKIRVCEEERTWEEGEFLIFDDSFEHEVWNNGTSVRLVLIVDVWHPDLTEEQRKNLDPI